MALRILIVNPNSSLSMTEALKPLVQRLRYENVNYTFFTAPSGPNSINDEKDADESVSHCLPSLLPLVATHSGILVACYSYHPLVHVLRSHTRSPVIGIMQSSILVSLAILGSRALSENVKFGIISTGKVWEKLLAEGVEKTLGGQSTLFSGVQTTGLSAIELHEIPAEIVRQKIREATVRLAMKAKGDNGEIGAVCLGCAGMSGMDESVRMGLIDALGEDKARSVEIVDGVVSGIGMLIGMIKSSNS